MVRSRTPSRNSYDSLTDSLELDEQKIKDLFRDLDVDRSGGINTEEWTQGLRDIGVPISQPGIEELMRILDTNNDGQISLEEFQKFVHHRYVMIERTWTELGLGEKKRVISSHELRVGIERAGMKVSDTQLRSFLLQVDADADGSVSFGDFMHCLMLLPHVNPDAIFEDFAADTPVDNGGVYHQPADVKRGASGDTASKIVTKLAAGAIAGAISRTSTAPLDRIRALQQATPPGTAPRSLMKVAADIWSENGIRAFFRGNGANCVKIAPETSFKFLFFDIFKQCLAKDPDTPTVSERFAAGGAAGACSSLAIYPLEIVKTRLSVSQPGTYTSIPHCLQTIAQQESFRALYKGLGPSLIGIVPYAGIDLAAMSLIKDTATKHYNKRGEEPGVLALLSCGMCSSTIAMAFTYPLNLVRTRLQASGMPGAPVYSGAGDCFRQAIRNDGFAGLYRGFFPNMLKVLPATSISFACYNGLQSALKTSSQ